MYIRPATRSDIEVIAQFQVLMAKETEDLELCPDTVLRGVAALFDSPSKGEYLIAELDDEVIGCLMLLPEWSDWRCGTVLWIHSVYVHPKARRKGVYRSLYAQVRERVEASAELRGIRLYVDERNKSAQKTYESLGMNGDHYKLYEWLKG